MENVRFRCCRGEEIACTVTPEYRHNHDIKPPLPGKCRWRAVCKCCKASAVAHSEDQIVKQRTPQISIAKSPGRCIDEGKTGASVGETSDHSRTMILLGARLAKAERRSAGSEGVPMTSIRLAAEAHSLSTASRRARVTDVSRDAERPNKRARKPRD